MQSSAYNEEHFNRCLDLMNLQAERAEMWKGAFGQMEKYRDFWKQMYENTEQEYSEFRKIVAGKN